jgi:hypothetical protein
MHEGEEQKIKGGFCTNTDEAEAVSMLKFI